MQTVRSKSERRTGRRIVIDLQKAERALKDGRHRDVEDICTEILEERPGHVYALQVLAELRLKEGRLAEATAAIEEAGAAEPDNPRTTNLLGRVHDIRGEHAEAEELFRKAVAAAPEYADAHANLGHVLRRDGRVKEAEAAFREAIRFDLEHGLANLSLGAMLYERGQPDLAVPHLQAGLKRELADRDGQYTLATALHELGRMDEAITAYRRLVATGDTDPAAFSNLAEALASTGDLEIASAGFEAALELDPGHGPAAAGLAGLLSGAGHPDAALKVLGPRMAGANPGPEVRIAHARVLRVLGRDDQALAQLNAVLKSDVSPRHAVVAHALVGDVLEAMGHHERAFAHYRRANLIRGARYDRARREDEVDRIIEVFTPETIDAIPRGSESEAPVFIVGMPCSGEGFVERIIGAHPRGAGVGALPHIGLSAGRIGRYNKAGVPYPECVSLLTRKDVQELSSGYLVRLLGGHDRARRIADSMWQNFDHLGFIEILFPRAQVIHCVRDPVETGLACYVRQFDGTGAEFAQDMGDIGHYYGQYRRLFAHWEARSRLRILEVGFEALSGDPEGEGRRILEFLGLPWDTACLQSRPGPHDRPVGWKSHYEAKLTPLAEALTAADVRPNA